MTDEMTLSELLDALDQRQALIVHFSHHAKMRGEGYFPQDLLDAIANASVWPLSCSVVWPEHEMDLVGSIGIIFRPNAIANILSLKNSDSASHGLTTLGEPLSPSAIERSFEVRAGEYNEWRSLGADVIGIFVTGAEGLCAKRWTTLEYEGAAVGRDIAAVPVELENVIAEFPGLPIITMTRNGPLRLA